MKTNVQEFVTFFSLFVSCQQWRARHAHKRCSLSLLSPFTQPFQPAVDGSLQMFLIFKSQGDSQSLFFVFQRDFSEPSVTCMAALSVAKYASS